MEKHSFEIHRDFFLDGKPIKIISGAIHYFRVVPEYWEDRLLKLKAMGCNTVETYVPWNLHEAKKGSFCFDGILDLVGFLGLAQKLGLWAVVRPTPYICGEWEFGGLPAWLLKEDGMRLRCSYKPFLQHVEDYYKVLLPKLSPLQAENGGPILMMQVENEYGAYGNEKAYLEAIRDSMRAKGITVPLVTSDGPWSDFLESGSVEGVHTTANFGSKAKEQFAILKKHVPNGPLMCMEFWVGWFDAWGDEAHHTTSPKVCAEDLDELLSEGSVNIYMFHGGTNFGFTNGSNYYGRLMPDVSSYDYDAPLSECGDITPKFLEMQKVIAKHKGEEPAALPQNTKKCEYGSFPVTKKVSLFSVLEDLDEPCSSPWPLSMEKLDQNFGYMLYRSSLSGKKPIKKLKLMGAADRAQVFTDREKQLTIYDTELLKEFDLDVEAPKQIDILVENMGRVNYGPHMESQRKGIDGSVQINGHGHAGWQMYRLPVDAQMLGKVSYDKQWRQGEPGFYMVNFNVDELGDSFLDLSGWGKGAVLLNGFQLGRFWEKGPQKRLYIPAPLLKIGENQLVIFETEGVAGDAISLKSEPLLG